MKVLVQSNDLQKATAKTAKIIGKSTDTIQEGIKITATDMGLTLTAVNTEMSVQTAIECLQTEDSGATVVNGKLFADFVGKLPNDTNIVLETTIDNNLHIYTTSKPKMSFKLSTMNASDFPVMNDYGETSSFEIMANDLKCIVNSTTFACSTDEARPILKGCLLENNEDELIMCAVDGYRLALCRKPIFDRVGDIKCVATARALNEMTRLVDTEESVKIMVHSNNIIMQTDNTVFTAKLLSGDFVNYGALLASPTRIDVVVNTESLSSAVDRATVLAKATQNNVIKLGIADDQMTVSTDNTLGAMEETIEVEQFGNDITIALNYKFLLDCIKATNSETVTMRFKDSNLPFFISSKADTAEYLILPVRVQ